MNYDELEQMLRRLLPAGMYALLDTRAQERGVTPEKLFDEAYERIMASHKLRVHAHLLRAQAIDDALGTGQPPPWPDNFDECLEVGLVLAALIQSGSENYLLEANGPEMDIIEEICRKEGISYEEFIQRAINAKLDGQEPPEKDGEGEEWKEQS